MTRKIEDSKSADLPSSSADQDLEKRKTNRLRRRKHGIHKLAINECSTGVLCFMFQNIKLKTLAGKIKKPQNNGEEPMKPYQPCLLLLDREDRLDDDIVSLEKQMAPLSNVQYDLYQ